MASFSSCGPTDDGRIKPEITMPGQGIISADFDGDVTANNCTRAAMSGTSMASPGAAGLRRVVRQILRRWLLSVGRGAAGDGINPSAALVRATMVSSDAGDDRRDGDPVELPGLGRVTLDDALYFGGDSRRWWCATTRPVSRAAPAARRARSRWRSAPGSRSR
jgi:subtilisin family serine protease